MIGLILGVLLIAAVAVAAHLAVKSAQSAGSRESDRADELARQLEAALKRATADSEARTTAERELSEMKVASTREIATLSAGLESAREARARTEADLAEARNRIETAAGEVTRLSAALAESTARMSEQTAAAEEKLNLLTNARVELTKEFEHLAAQILEAKSTKFGEDSKKTLDGIINPLGKQLTEFKASLDAMSRHDSQSRAHLSGQIESMARQQLQLSQDAQALTQALKGSAKARGDWGETILERILDMSGLREGEEYLKQKSRVDGEGTSYRPDIAINLPRDRCIVLDSKMLLSSYLEYRDSESEEVASTALRAHVQALRARIRELSSKRYEDLVGVRTLDFVVAFVPIEAALTAAIDADPDLFDTAWRSNVLVASPTTLMCVVRTVAHLWTQERQNRNVQKVIDRGRMLHGKFCDFVKDLEEVGKAIKKSGDWYTEAMKKLTTGNGNLVRQAEMLREYGAASTKSLPASVLEMAGVDDEPLFIEAIPASHIEPQSE